jgi:hypothetical protein
MVEQAAAETARFLASWTPDGSSQNQTAGALANELREAVAAKPDAFSAAAETFAPLRPLFVRHYFDGLLRATRQNAGVHWAACLALAQKALERAKTDRMEPVPVPGDDPDWSWALKTVVDWVSAGLRRGAEGFPFECYTAVRALVLALAEEAAQAPAPKEEDLARSLHPYFAAQQTLFGATIELAVLFLFWASKDAGSPIGKAPREALAQDGDVRRVLEQALARNGTAGCVARAIVGRYLNWLCYFGEAWVEAKLSEIFPKEDDGLRRAAWVAHVQSDQHPAATLAAKLSDLYAEHIAEVGRDDDAFGGNDSRNRLMDYLVILYLWEKLPEDLLQAM